MADGRGAKPGERRGGRQKGTPNKGTAKTRDELWAYVWKRKKVNPLEFLLDQVSNTKLDRSLRIQCAGMVLPYMASKLQPVDPASGLAEQHYRIRVVLHGPSDD